MSKVIELLGPEKEVSTEFQVFGLEKYEVYDVLAYLIQGKGLKAVSEELKNYLNDQAEAHFTKIEFEEGGNGLIGLASARALDACGVVAEALTNFAEQYEL